MRPDDDTFAEAVLERLDAIAAAVGVPAAEDVRAPPTESEQAAQEVPAEPRAVHIGALPPQTVELLRELSAALGRPPGAVIALALRMLVAELERGKPRADGGPLVVAAGAADVPPLALPRANKDLTHGH